MSWNEDRLHRWLAGKPRPSILRGSPGHDAAVTAAPRGREVLCCDQTIEGVHFDPAAPPRAVGRKAANRALSDLAATAARPRTLLLALRAPLRKREEWLKAAIEGVREAGAAVGAELVGGDLAGAPGPAALSVTATGVLEGRQRPPGRDRARPGQVLVLTGKVGGSGLGRHLRFTPRIAEGRRLFAAGATAMMDVSDGLAWDLWRLARAAGVSIELRRVPLHRDAHRAAKRSGRDPLDHALHDGEDHELVATLPRRALVPGCVRIGSVRRGEGLFLAPELVGDEGFWWNPRMGGWVHGG